jgi:hypothetical protein
MITSEGKLFVEIKSESMYFGYDVPVEVRDSEMRLVKGPTNERRFNLPVGLYEVSAVLEDGRKHRQLVQINEQGETIAKLGPVDDPQASLNIAHADPESFLSYERPRLTQNLDTYTEAEVQTALTLQLLDVKGASLYKEGRRHWVFQCTEELAGVAYAIVLVGDRKLRISLPVSPERPFPNNSCVVKVEETHSGVLVNAWISKERIVANALQNMMASGYMLKAAEMAKDAIGLLRDKYSDPTGAALGALILYKVGTLERWLSWLENLARDFDWLPDGKVMLAKLLYDGDIDRHRALNLAVRASAQRMLFSESYSILLDLLRRWPREIDDTVRQQAADRLARQASCVDWAPICFTEVNPEEE